MMQYGIDFKVDQKYLYVAMAAPIPSENGDTLPNLEGKVLQCLIIRKEHVGKRYIFKDDKDEIFFCRRIPIQMTGYFNDKNLIEKSEKKEGEPVVVLYIPLEELEEMFKKLYTNPVDEKHKRFCEKAIERLKQIKEEYETDKVT